MLVGNSELPPQIVQQPLVTPEVAEVAGTSARCSQNVAAKPPVVYNHDGADMVVPEAVSTP